MHQVFANRCCLNCTHICFCKKWNEGWRVSCSGLNLTSFPVFQNGVVWIDLSHNNLTSFPERKTFPNSLRYLDLSLNPLRHIPRDTFQNMPDLRSLTLTNCTLRNIERNALSQLRSLRILDISHNQELSFAVMNNVTRDLRSTKIEILKANMIHCLFGMGTQLMLEDTINLQNTSLKELHLETNRIMIIQSGVTMFLPRTLEYVSLRDNMLTLGLYVMETANMVGLKAADHSGQRSHHDWYQIWTPCKENQRQMRSSNPKIFSSFEHKEQSKLGIWIPDFTHLIAMPVPQHLETVYFNSSYIVSQIPGGRLSNNKAKHLYFQDNVLYQWIGPVRNVESVETFNLSNNFCSELSTQFFDGFIGLKTLLLNNNMIGYSLKSDVKGLSFKYLKNLETLEINSNKINLLPRNIFFNLTSLKYLRLSNNTMRKFIVDIIHMQDLEILDLSNNELTGLRETFTQNVDILSKNSPRFRLIFSGNPIRCDCENLDFIRWVSSSKNIAFEKSDFCITTKAENGRVYMTNIAEFHVQLEKNCKSYIGLIISTICLVIVIVTAIFGVIVYRYRWKIRYLYYIMKGQYFGYKTLRRNDDENIYEYDAFISYADEDREFALHKMIENIEKNDIRLCFHSRDFTPGFDIAENITNAIHNSRKTVCVLSPAFLSSYWCMYELNIARMESIYSRKGENTLFLIVYGNIKACDLPLTIMDLVDKKSYIEYPDDPQGDVVFWRKVREVIGTE